MSIEYTLEFYHMMSSGSYFNSMLNIDVYIILSHCIINDVAFHLELKHGLVLGVTGGAGKTLSA